MIYKSLEIPAMDMYKSLYKSFFCSVLGKKSGVLPNVYGHEDGSTGTVHE